MLAPPLLALLFTTATLFGPDARDIGARAMMLEERGRHADAVRLLRTALDETEPRDRAGRAVLLFHLGYVQDRWSSSDLERTTDHLRASVHAYRSVLELYPENGKAAQNLALVLQRSEDPRHQRESAALLRALAAGDGASGSDRGSAARASLAIGDRHLRNERRSEAMDAYRRAAKLDWDDPLVHERILDSYERWSDGSWTSGEMLKYCDRLADTGFGVQAARGLAALVKSTHRADPKTAEQALLRWVEVRLELGTLTVDALAELPATERWKADALEQLRPLVRGDAKPSGLGWWRETDERAHVAAMVYARRAAEATVLTKEPRRAAELYERALEVAPDPQEYGSRALTGRDPARLEAAVAYARLLHAHRTELDPEQTKTRDLVDRLFNDKMLSYANRDLRSIRRYHVTLGMILADRGEWTEGGIAQLNLALDAERQLADAEQREPQPQSKIRLSLADGYEATGAYEAAYAQAIGAAKDSMASVDERAVETSLGRASELLGKIPESKRAIEELQLRELEKVRVEHRRFDALPLKEKERELDVLEGRLTGSRPEYRHLDPKWRAAQLELLSRKVEIEALEAGDLETANRAAAKAKRGADAAGPRGCAVDRKMIERIERLREEGTPKKRGGGR